MTPLTNVGKVILGALRSRPQSGYEIKRLVDRSTRFFWAASYGQIYPELRRLEEEALIVGTSAPRGGRPRRVYRLTARGRAALRDWLLQGEAAYEVRDEGLLKLFFADALPPNEALALVRSLRERRESVLERLREVDRTRPRGVEGFPNVVLAFGIELHEWIVEWYATFERELARGEHRRRKVGSR